LRLLRELVPLFSDGASVVWIGSSSWRQPIPGLDASNAFRPGIAALVKVLARELAPGLRLVGMAPGRIDTDRVRSLDSSRAERTGDSLSDVRTAAEAEIPMGRYGEPEEFGRVAAVLLSPAAPYVSGSTVHRVGLCSAQRWNPGASVRARVRASGFAKRPVRRVRAGREQRRVAR